MFKGRLMRLELIDQHGFGYMCEAWDNPGFGAEMGRIWGQKGCYVPEKGGYTGWFQDEVWANPGSCEDLA